MPHLLKPVTTTTAKPSGPRARLPAFRAANAGHPCPHPLPCLCLVRPVVLKAWSGHPWWSLSLFQGCPEVKTHLIIVTLRHDLSFSLSFLHEPTVVFQRLRDMWHWNRLNPEADVRSQLFSAKPDITETGKNVKQSHSSH